MQTDGQDILFETIKLMVKRGSLYTIFLSRQTGQEFPRTPRSSGSGEGKRSSACQGGAESGDDVKQIAIGFGFDQTFVTVSRQGTRQETPPNLAYGRTSFCKPPSIADAVVVAPNPQ